MSDFVVDTIFPTQEVHLIAGPSGAGKSTWLLQFIDGWRQGKPFLTYAVHPQPFVYISGDRSKRSVERTFARLGLKQEDFNCETAASLISTDLFKLIDDIIVKYPTARVLFIEGFQSFTPGAKMNDYGEVAKFLTKLLKVCVTKNITVFGVCHATKTKKDETYENPRQKINGSVAWAAYSETVVFLEPNNPANPDDASRKVMLLPRNAAERMYTMEFKGGKLIEKTKPQSPWDKLSKWIESVVPDTEVSTAELLVATSMPSSSLQAEVTKAINMKLLMQVKHGVYRRLAAGAKTDA